MIPGRCALVLGGGGPLGFAWETGVLQGWADSRPSPAGSNKPDTSGPLAPFLAGRIIGTSAGAIVAAHLAVHGSLDALLTDSEIPEAARGVGMVGFFLAYLKAKLLSRGLDGFRRSMGKSARAAALPGEAAWIGAIEEAIGPAAAWPQHCDLHITAIDAETGEFHDWTGTSAVPLAAAVAASCSAPCIFPLVHLQGRGYMDGGIGSPTNAALAAGCGRVVVLDPLGRMMGNAAPLELERRALEAGGSSTLAFAPDQAVANAIGHHFLDLSRCPRVRALGREQGRASAAAVWRFVAGGGGDALHPESESLPVGV